tara:strand:- start:375 stop:821 length:447 start_codon:yes stop_codon:yes gene_type:complete
MGRALATWFGSGLLPKAPGTWGSLAALPFAWVIVTVGGPWVLAAATVIIYLVGIWATRVFLRTTDDPDPGPVVIDEVAGMWMTLIMVPPDLLIYAFGFVAFRIVDIFKPWPAGWADRSVKGAQGVMLDDVLAAIYSAAATWAFAEYVV